MNQPEVIIRHAKTGDIEDMVQLLKDLFSIEDDFVFDYEKQKLGLCLMLDGCLKHKCIMVAEINQKVIGMCSAQTLISTAEGGIVALVEDVIVKKEWRGKGIGTKIMDHIINWAQTRGYRRIQLLADKNNSSGIKFYEKNNWEVTQLICLRKKNIECCQKIQNT